jgi:indole-3-pyruvate monooxygenase
MRDHYDAVVIGAGFSGLGAAAALRTAGIERFVVLEQGQRVGHFWSTTYDRLHLHSAYHDMPSDGGLRRRYPTFLSRDELLDYFQRYAALHQLEPHLRLGWRVDQVKRVAAAAQGAHGWELETSRGRVHARCLAVATATNRVPKSPDLPGRSDFAGRVLHSAEYRNPAPFRGRSVLVVGSGNSAAEISLDLVEGGARDVSMWVRAPRHFIPIRRMAVLFWVFRALGAFSEAKADAMHRITAGTPEFDRIVDQRDRIMGRLSVDLSRYGIRKPSVGPNAETFRTGRIPTFDQGAIPLIRGGRIRVIDGNVRPLERFTRRGVVLGAQEVVFDDVILATGFVPGLEAFLADREVLAADGRPLTDGRSRSTVYPSLFFPGFDRTLLGGHSLGRWGWEVGGKIVQELGNG